MDLNYDICLFFKVNDTATKKKGAEDSAHPTAYSKPSESFYNKLLPLLRDHGITNLDNRKEWPASVMKQVQTELKAETPSNLLSQEVWFASVDSAHWHVS